jgi:mRNA interferase RelE/StbE
MKIEISKRAEKDLAKLETDIRNRIIIELLDLENNFADKDIRKLKGEKNLWRLRVGDYRIIMEINQERLVITALHVAHRREVYR